METFSVSNSREQPTSNLSLEKPLENSKDQKELSVYPYFSVFLFPLLALYFPYVFHTTWQPLFFMYLFIPVLEIVFGSDGYNPSVEECQRLEKRFSFRLVTFLWVPTQLAIILFGCYFCEEMYAISFAKFLGLSFMIGTVSGGVGITVAHELIHKQNRFEQTLGKILLISCCYGHFFVEHLWGHHKRVATQEDPATSRRGETLYEFLPRTIWGSLTSALDLENKRIFSLLSSRKEKDFSVSDILRVHFTNNQILHTTLASLGLASLAGWYFGRMAVLFFLLQSIFAFMLLEMINYIEHYGLQRKILPAGVYEKVTPLHSWNADHYVTNYILFKLQRHADHHTWPTRRYQTLRSWDFSPQLPTGYAGMLLLSLFPPIFHYIMNEKVDRYNEMLLSQSSLMTASTK